MFKLASPDTLYRTDVEVVVPQEKGGAQAFDIVVLMRCLPHDHYLDYTVKGDAEVVRQVVGGWEGIEDEAGEPLPFTQENLATLSGLPYFSAAVLFAYGPRFAPRKNS